MRNVGVALAGLALVLGLGIGGSADETMPAFKVVVNPSITGQKLPREVLAQIYLGTAQRWGDGRPIVPVDRSITASLREAFAGAVLGMPVAGLQSYWLRNIANGKRPPMIKGSDEEVIAFVASEPGAVGYVSDSAAVPSTVRVVAIQ